MSQLASRVHKLARSMQRAGSQTLLQERTRVTGSYNDVFKHSILSELVGSIGGTGQPWTFMDCFPVAPVYDITRLKVQSYENPEEFDINDVKYRAAIREVRARGIDRVIEWDRTGDNPQASPFYNYLSCIRDMNAFENTFTGKKSKLQFNFRHYPGSVMFALPQLRRHDTALICHHNPELLQLHQAYLEGYVSPHMRRVFQYVNQSPFQFFHTYGKPTTSNGIVYMDCDDNQDLDPNHFQYRKINPSTILEEHNNVFTAVKLFREMVVKWPTATYMLTFSMKTGKGQEDFEEAIKDIAKSGMRQILYTYWHFNQAHEEFDPYQGTYAVIVNPPPGFEFYLNELQDGMEQSIIRKHSPQPFYVDQLSGQMRTVAPVKRVQWLTRRYPVYQDTWTSKHLLNAFPRYYDNPALDAEVLRERLNTIEEQEKESAQPEWDIYLHELAKSYEHGQMPTQPYKSQRMSRRMNRFLKDMEYMEVGKIEKQRKLVDKEAFLKPNLPEQPSVKDFARVRDEATIARAAVQRAPSSEELTYYRLQRKQKAEQKLAKSN